MSLSQNMAEEDKIPTDEVMRHEERNNLYSYLGKKSFQSYVSRKIKLLETDMIALYTRGIWENVEEAELDDVFAQADNEVQNTVDNIEDLLLSRTPEHIDNYTLAVIFINKVYQNPRKAKWRKRAIQISIVLVVLIGGVCLTMWILLRRKQQNITDMNYHFTNTIEYINTGNYIRAKEECTAAQELAEKLKDTVMRERLQEYLFVIEAVILGDESYSSKDYDSANEQYMRAMDRARYADHIGADYIEGKLDKISEILSVEIAIQLGDELLEQGDYEGAEIKYLLAKDIALAIRDSEGKQNAIEALEKLYEKKAEAESKQKEEAEAQAKEEVSAAQMLAEGDRAALEEDYVAAKVYYAMAAAKYEELKDNSSKELIQEKLAAIEEKLTEQEKLAAEREELKKQAMAYENQGSACRQSGDLWGAKSNYLSAKSIYQQLEDNEAEEIVDRLGRRRSVRRAELLQHFFQYIIQRTENRFKCRISQVHLSSPVKQKYYFKKMFESILPKYQINSEGMLDEGMAVLYNTIAGMIERKALEEGETYEALMIDCGGGTTDLCSYRFCVENRKAAYRIDMKTTYENGDTDFGGNNLTYRIMQLLKIALAHSDRDVEIPGVKAILESMDTDVYRFVDTQGVKAFYRHLDEAYEQAEKVLPTRFADYEQYQRKEYYKVKNNFYTLFDLAEQVKKRMYGRVGTLKVIVTTDRDQKENGSVLMDKWKLSFYQGEELLVKKEIPEIIFNYFEIELLLSGEIYGIVRKFMEGMYQTGRLMDFSFIRLTGQSCKIALFKDALKEFVPGRMIQFRKRGEADSTDIKLKLSCVDGAIKYLRDKKYGTADIHQDNTKAVIPYRIMGYTHSGKEVTLVDGFGDWSRAQTVSRHLEDMVLSLYLQDGMGEEHWKYRYICKPEDFRPVTYEQISEIYGKYILQKETDSIENGDVKFFLWAKQEEWGFQVVPVCCREDELYLGKAEFFHFESDSWINNFFDGRK